MTQLIINGTEFPETSQDNYICRIEERNEYIRTASGRVVELVGVRFIVIEYTYGLMRPEFLRDCIVTLRSVSDLDVLYLTPEGTSLDSGLFKCTEKPAPFYAFSHGGKGHFHKISFRLEGVEGLA